MGVTERKRLLALNRTTALFFSLLLLFSFVPAASTVYDFVYSSNTATVRSPSVTLLAGTKGSSTISSIESDAATISATAGLTYFENSNAQTSTPALDGSASQGFTPGVVQHTSNSCGSAATCAKAYASNVVSGDIMVVSIEWVGAVMTPTITDGQAGARCASWTAVTGSPVTSTAETAMWFCKAATSGAATPTVSWTTSRVSKLDIYEVSGYTSTGLTCNTNSGTGTAMSVASTSFSGSPFLVASYARNSGTITAGTSFTLSDTSAAADGGSGEFATSGITSPTTFPATGSTSGSAAHWAGIGCEFPKATAASTTLTLSTSGTSDVIYVGIEILNSGSQTVSTVTDTSSLTYTQRQSATLGTNVRVETWFATTTSTLSSDVITVTLSGMADFALTGFAVSGVDTASPFDPGVSSPPTGTGTSISPSASITTTFPNDIIVGVVAAQNAPSVTAGSGFSIVVTKSPTSNTLTGSTEDKQVTSVQSGSSVSFTLGASQNWAMIGDAIAAGKPTATVDTSVTTPGSSGTFTLVAGASAFLWSGSYTAGGTLFNGNWVLDLWASKATSSGTLTVSILVVGSTNAVTSTILSSGTTGTISTSTSEVLTTFAGSGATVPTNGEILVVLTNPVGSTTVTVSWGGTQQTNFQSPSTYNYVLRISNSASSTWNVNLATLSSGGQTSLLGRLTATLSFVSPASNQIVVAGGTLTQASGSTVTLAASGTIDIQLVATANSIPTSSNVPSTITLSIVIAASTGTVYAQYTVVLTVN